MDIIFLILILSLNVADQTKDYVGIDDEKEETTISEDGGNGRDA